MNMNQYILIVTAVYPPEPVVSAHLSEDIYERLKKEGEEVRVLHPIPTRPNGYQFGGNGLVNEDEIVADSFTCPESKIFGRFKESYSFGMAAYSYITKHYKEIKVIYANTWPLFGQYFLAKAAKKYGIPYYIHVQDIYPESYCYKMPRLLGKFLYNILIPMDKYVQKNATGVIGISPAMISYLSESRQVEKSKFTLVRNWQDDQTFIDAYSSIEHEKAVCEVMYLGSINPTAHVDLLIKAFSKLESDRYHLSIIGNGSEKEDCQRMAKQLGVNVIFDVADPEQVAQIQATANILVLCLKEGVAKTATPSKLTAYMLTGRPIVASVDLESDCAKIIREAACGEVVEPENEEALSEAIKQINNKPPKEKDRMGNAAFEYALNNLSKERNLNILTELIKK